MLQSELKLSFFNFGWKISEENVRTICQITYDLKLISDVREGKAL